MLACYKEYRAKNMVSTFIDPVHYPDGYENPNLPDVVLSKWALSGGSGNLDKAAVAGHTASAVLSLGAGLVGLGMGGGISGLSAGISSAANSTGKVFDAVNDSNVSALQVAAEKIANEERECWDGYYYLIIFEPAEGNIGEAHLGDSNNERTLGHWFLENGDYHEGLLLGNGTRWGIFIFANGSRYYGRINAAGFREDIGIEVSPDGSRLYGRYENGQLVWGLYECEQCAMLGTWSNGVLHGAGIARYADNSVFVGEWIDGKPVS